MLCVPIVKCCMPMHLTVKDIIFPLPIKGLAFLHLPLESPEQIKKWRKFVFKNFIISFAPVSKKSNF